jgi:hypothetical protein
MDDKKITTRQIGDSLELGVEHIFKIAGFNTKRNQFRAGYEIDVEAEIGNRKVLIECKNYQKSNLTIRNIIHQWNSKNQLIKAHKIIIVIAGLTIKDSDYELASEFDIELWSQDDLTELFKLSLKPYELKLKLIAKIDVKPISIDERYRDELTYFIIRPLLFQCKPVKEDMYRMFNQFLRSHILTELEMQKTNAEQRKKYIEIFEDSKLRKGFIKLFDKKRSQEEYWDVVYQTLQDSDLLSNELQSKYVGHMDLLKAEHSRITSFFENDDHFVYTKKLLQSRMYFAYDSLEVCNFFVAGMKNSVEISFDTGIGIYIENISREEANILNWILTSQGHPIVSENKVVGFTWYSSSIDDAVEKVYRLFTEYYQTTKSSPIIDTSLR